MNEKIRNYFSGLAEQVKTSGKKLTYGEQEAYWNYRRSLENDNGEFECSELPWATDMSDFVDTLRKAGVKTIVVTEHSSALMENLHKLAVQGYTLDGLCTVIHQNIWGEPENVYGIRFTLN